MFAWTFHWLFGATRHTANTPHVDLLFDFDWEFVCCEQSVDLQDAQTSRGTGKGVGEESDGFDQEDTVVDITSTHPLEAILAQAIMAQAISVQDGIARACSSVALLCCCAFSATAVHESQQEVGSGGQFIRGSLEDDFEGPRPEMRDMWIEQVKSSSSREEVSQSGAKERQRVNPRMQAHQCRAPRFPSQTSTQTSS